MKQGQSKLKGNSFEVKISKELSSWISHGTREDLLDRTSNSGGKATMHKKAGRFFGNIAGDLMAVGVDGHKLTDYFVIELKHQNEQNLNITNLIFQSADSGITVYWKKLLEECKTTKKYPMLIFRQNSRPIYMALCQQGVQLLQCQSYITTIIKLPAKNMHLIPFTVFLTKVTPDHLTIKP